MLIEQMIEFELRGAGPPSRTCTPMTGYFYDKTKISKEIDKSSSELLFTAKILQEAPMYLTFLCWAKSLTKFNTKMADFKRVFGLSCQLKEN